MNQQLFVASAATFKTVRSGSLSPDVMSNPQADSVGDAIAILQNATKVAQEIQEEVLRTDWGTWVV